MSRGFPITLTNLQTKLCLVVGGGQVAERKVCALLSADAHVLVVAPEVTPLLADLAQQRAIGWLPRDFEPGDLADAFVVIVATNDTSLNHEIARQAMERGCLVNVVDDPEYCNFITPAVVRRGDLTIAVCTGGQVPALSGHLRAEFEQQFGPEWESYVRLLAALREQIATRYPDSNARRDAWQRVLRAELVKELAGEGEAQIRARFAELIAS